MKKIVFALLLSSTIGFAINPKKIESDKDVLKNALVLKNINKSLSLKILNKTCYDYWVETFDNCIKSGMSIDKSAAVAYGAYTACNAVVDSLSGN
jgi:hypothetical protein